MPLLEIEGDLHRCSPAWIGFIRACQANFSDKLTAQEGVPREILKQELNKFNGSLILSDDDNIESNLKSQPRIYNHRTTVITQPYIIGVEFKDESDLTAFILSFTQKQ